MTRATAWRRAPAHDEGEESRDRWLVSYADFITLLMAFFVVLYSVSSVNAGKFRVLSNSLVTVFNEAPSRPVPIDLGGGAPPPRATTPAVAEPAGAQVAPTAAADATSAPPLSPLPVGGSPRERLAATLAPLVAKDLAKIRETRDWLELEIAAELLFASGSAELEAAATPVLARIAEVVGPLGQTVQVEGHTDNVPVARGRYRSNWQLSAARAATIAERLAAGQLPPSRLAAVGYGEFRPITDNGTVSGRRQNRRVVIAIARHPGVAVRDSGLDVANAGEPAGGTARNLQRVTELPGPAEIEP